MKIIIAASEAMPYIKTGGLADVAGAIYKEYRKMGMEAYLVLPLYRSIRENFSLTDTGIPVSVHVADRLVEGRIFSDGSSAYFLECDEFFDRDELYGTPEGDYVDNAERFSFFGRAVLEACRALRLRPDVIHCNDWQTALIPVHIGYDGEFFGSTATVMTIHNLGYQGLFKMSDFSATGLGREWLNPEGIEFFGRINFLKAGIIASDIITTVSGTYAKEILGDELGFGLEGVLKKRSGDLYGVINGIDTDEWNPVSDRLIPANYSSSDLSGKALCRKELAKECFSYTEDADAPLVAFIGRLAAQKGVDIFLEAAGDIVAAGARIIILGKGDELYHNKLRVFYEAHRRSVFMKIGYDEAFAHRIYAGSDILIMPSRYEPCGLSQLISMRYGTIPVARRTGGLADTITDYESLTGPVTGFLFDEYGASSLLDGLKRAFRVYAERERWKSVIASAMGMDYSWGSSARTYRGLYEKAVEKRLKET